MFFVFLILLFTFHITDINSIALRNKIIQSRNKQPGGKGIFFKDDIKNNSSCAKYGPLFQSFQNSSNSMPPNLQANVYDKILLDEMFSVKQLHNRNIKHNTKAPIFPRITALTPTLDVKQKWPTIELLVNSKTQNGEKNETVPRSTIQFIRNIHRDVKKNRTKNKVVELRSIPEDLKHHQEPLQNIPVRYCTCIKSNAYTSCSHRENEKMCTHTPKYDFRHEPGILTPYPAFYLPYQSYFLSATTDYPYKITYYHPNIINELKVPKKKKHRYTTTTQYDDDLYYENSYNKAKKKYYDYLENDKNSDKDFHKPKKDEVIINIDYDVRNEGSKKPEQGTAKKDPDLHDIINDLDPVYSDCAMKKCYCSSSMKYNFNLFYTIPYITFAASMH